MATTTAPDWGKLEPFYVGVPHQRQPFVVTKRAADQSKPPLAEDGDTSFEGDHDLHGVQVVETQQDAELLLDPHDHERPGGQARHQAAAIAAVVRAELVAQGVLPEDD